MRTLAELTTTDDPAWQLIEKWIADAPEVEVLPAEPTRADAALLQLQVTVRSPMGAVVHRSGGLLVDHGWLRILGSGSARMDRSLPGWNEGRAPLDESGRPGLLLVADDVLGGLFAVNGGLLDGTPGHVCYLAPDTLRWENLGIGYSDFLAWALTPRLADFYRDLRWPDWQDEVGHLSGDQALSIYPFLWAQGEPIERRSRRTVSIGESFDATMDMKRQLGA